MMMDDQCVTISKDLPLPNSSWNSDKTLAFKREDVQSKEDIGLVFVHGDRNGISDDHLEQVIEFCSNVVDFNQLDESIDFITGLSDTAVFLILSEFENLDFICLINDIEQIHSIYIFDSQLIHKNYGIGTSNKKVKSINHQFRHLCYALSTNIQQSLIISKSFSFLGTSSTENGNQLESSFMYTQLFKEIFLELDYDKDKAKKEFIDFCRDSSSPSSFKSKDVDQFEKNYQASNALWWYTQANFLYFNVNQALRTQDVEILLKMGFFIQDLHLNIKQRYNEENNRTPLTLYRGQGLSEINFEKMKNSERGLIGFNSFLSTSRDEDAAKMLADSNQYCPGMVGILFRIDVDTSITSTPFTYLGELSQHPDEEEVLFSMHSVFRIGKMRKIQERLWEVNLTLTSDTDPDLMCLTEHLRETFTTSNKWIQLCHLLMGLGMLQKAVQIYESAENARSSHPQDSFDFMKQTLYMLKSHFDSGQYSLSIEACERMMAELPTDSTNGNIDSAAVYFFLGALLECQGDYSSALSKFQKAMELITDQQQESSQLSIDIYILIGWVQQQMCQYEDAYVSYETALKIARSNLPENHPNLATILNYLGSLYALTGNYDKSLAHLNEAHSIQERFLPAVHLEKIKVHSNIGSTHLQRGSYSMALEHSKYALDMLCKIDSKDHTITIKIYGNMAQAYIFLNRVDDAKTYLEEALALAQKVLPPNHPMIAICLSDMATFHGSQGNYDEAIKRQKEALQIQYDSTNLNYLNLAGFHNNMAAILVMGGKYVDALEHANKALENQKRALTGEHVNMGLSYATIGDTYQCLGKTAEAISYYQRALEIFQKFLPSDHPRITSVTQSMNLLHMITGDYATTMNGITQLQKQVRSHVSLNSDRQDLSSESASFIDNLTEPASVVVTNLIRGPNVEENNATSLIDTMTKGFESILKLAPSNSHLIRLTEKEKACISSLSEGLQSFKTCIENSQKRVQKENSKPYRGSSSTNVTETKNFLEDMVGHQVKFLETCRGMFPNNHAYPAMVANMNGKIYLSSGQYSCALTLFQKAMDCILECEPINEELLTEVQENIEKAKEGLQFYAEHFECP